MRHDPPVVRVKRLEDETIQVTRLAEPQHEVSRNLVTVNYGIFLRDKVAGTLEEIREEHPMRYLFLPEMEGYLEGVGLRFLSSGGWLGENPLSSSTWYGWVCAQRLP